MDEFTASLLGQILSGLCANPMITRPEEGMDNKQLAVEAIGIMEETLLILGDMYGTESEEE